MKIYFLDTCCPEVEIGLTKGARISTVYSEGAYSLQTMRWNNKVVYRNNITAMYLYWFKGAKAEFWKVM